MTRYVDEHGWVNMEAWTGRPLRSLPKSIREPDEALSHCSSITAATGDICCDPRSGGIADVSVMAEMYGVGEQQFRRNILPNLDYVRWLGNIPVMHQNSGYIGGMAYRDEVRRQRSARLGIMTDCSSGTWPV